MKKNIAALTLALVFLTSCSLTKFVGYYRSAGQEDSGNLSGLVYTTDDTSYKIGELPPGWSRIEIKGGDLAFGDASGDSTITVNSTCDERKMRYSLKALSESLIIGISGKEAESREPITIDGQEALRTIYTGSLENVPVKIDARVFKKGICIYDFTYASSPESFGAGEAAYDSFVSQFRVL